jgi:hypothetical protein
MSFVSKFNKEINNNNLGGELPSFTTSFGITNL